MNKFKTYAQLVKFRDGMVSSFDKLLRGVDGERLVTQLRELHDNNMANIRNVINREATKRGGTPIYFVGIDDFNRPVFRHVLNKKAYFGNLNILFPYGEGEASVLEKVTAESLEYFGDHFGCEPHGGNSAVPLKIVPMEEAEVIKRYYKGLE